MSSDKRLIKYKLPTITFSDLRDMFEKPTGSSHWEDIQRQGFSMEFGSKRLEVVVISAESEEIFFQVQERQKEESSWGILSVSKGNRDQTNDLILSWIKRQIAKDREDKGITHPADDLLTAEAEKILKVSSGAQLLNKPLSVLEALFCLPHLKKELLENNIPFHLVVVAKPAPIKRLETIDYSEEGFLTGVKLTNTSQGQVYCVKASTYTIDHLASGHDILGDFGQMQTATITADFSHDGSVAVSANWSFESSLSSQNGIEECLLQAAFHGESAGPLLSQEWKKTRSLSLSELRYLADVSKEPDLLLIIKQTLEVLNVKEKGQINRLKLLCQLYMNKNVENDFSKFCRIVVESDRRTFELVKTNIAMFQFLVKTLQLDRKTTFSDPTKKFCQNLLLWSTREKQPILNYSGIRDQFTMRVNDKDVSICHAPGDKLATPVVISLWRYFGYLSITDIALNQFKKDIYRNPTAHYTFKCFGSHKEDDYLKIGASLSDCFFNKIKGTSKENLPDEILAPTVEEQIAPSTVEEEIAPTTVEKQIASLLKGETLYSELTCQETLKAGLAEKAALLLKEKIRSQFDLFDESLVDSLAEIMNHNQDSMSPKGVIELLDTELTCRIPYELSPFSCKISNDIQSSTIEKTLERTSEGDFVFHIRVRARFYALPRGWPESEFCSEDSGLPYFDAVVNQTYDLRRLEDKKICFYAVARFFPKINIQTMHNNPASEELVIFYFEKLAGIYKRYINSPTRDPSVVEDTQLLEQVRKKLYEASDVAQLRRRLISVLEKSSDKRSILSTFYSYFQNLSSNESPSDVFYWTSPNRFYRELQKIVSSLSPDDPENAKKLAVAIPDRCGTYLSLELDDECSKSCKAALHALTNLRDLSQLVQMLTGLFQEKKPEPSQSPATDDEEQLRPIEPPATDYQQQLLQPIKNRIYHLISSDKISYELLGQSCQDFLNADAQDDLFTTSCKAAKQMIDYIVLRTPKEAADPGDPKVLHYKDMVRILFRRRRENETSDDETNPTNPLLDSDLVIEAQKSCSTGLQSNQELMHRVRHQVWHIFAWIICFITIIPAIIRVLIRACKHEKVWVWAVAQSEKVLEKVTTLFTESKPVGSRLRVDASGTQSPSGSFDDQSNSHKQGGARPN